MMEQKQGISSSRTHAGENPMAPASTTNNTVRKTQHTAAPTAQAVLSGHSSGSSMAQSIPSSGLRNYAASSTRHASSLPQHRSVINGVRRDVDPSVIHSVDAKPGPLGKLLEKEMGRENLEESTARNVQYTNVKPVGNGSFGVVFQATLMDGTPSGKLVAIKKVLQDRRFKNRELQIMCGELSSLVSSDKLPSPNLPSSIPPHPNVVALLYYFYSSDQQKKDEVFLNLILEYVPETLYRACRHYAKLKQPMPTIQIKTYMYQVFRSLAFIHSFGICHRDIKPQNLLINPATYELKLCDFGSAKLLVPSEPNVSYICSRYYRAPELIFGATNYTHAIDIWSAGCVFAELILGTPLFPGDTGVDQLVEIIKVLGTPSRHEISDMNKNYTEFKFPQIKPHAWDKVFRGRAGADCIDLMEHILIYTPFKRFDAFGCMSHRFFDELRDEKLHSGDNVQATKSSISSPSTSSSNSNVKKPPCFFDFSVHELRSMGVSNARKLVPTWYEGELLRMLKRSDDMKGRDTEKFDDFLGEIGSI